MVHGLEGAGGGEAPARAALTLVLDRGHGAFLPPVHVEGEGSGVGRHKVLGAHEPGFDAGGVLAPVPVHGGDEFMAEEVPELVHLL